VSPFVVLYRWRDDPAREADFVEAWSAITRRLRDRVGSGGLAGSRGSRLHRGDDGLWYAYAVWQDERSREQAFAESEEAAKHDPAWAAHRRTMRDAVVERLPEVRLEIVADELVKD